MVKKHFVFVIPFVSLFIIYLNFFFLPPLKKYTHKSNNLDCCKTKACFPHADGWFDMYIFLKACGVGELPELFCSSIYQWTCYKYHSHFSPDKSRHRSEVQAIWETTLHHGTGVDYYTHAEPIFSIHRPMWISSRKPIRHVAITKLTPTNFSKTPQHDQKPSLKVQQRRIN